MGDRMAHGQHDQDAHEEHNAAQDCRAHGVGRDRSQAELLEHQPAGDAVRAEDEFDHDLPDFLDNANRLLFYAAHLVVQFPKPAIQVRFSRLLAGDGGFLRSLLGNRPNEDDGPDGVQRKQAQPTGHVNGLFCGWLRCFAIS
jgi:hypothetical protein